MLYVKEHYVGAAERRGQYETEEIATFKHCNRSFVRTNFHRDQPAASQLQQTENDLTTSASLTKTSWKSIFESSCPNVRFLTCLKYEGSLFFHSNDIPAPITTGRHA